MADKAPQKFRPTAEVGRSGLKMSGGAILEEYDPDLRGLKGVKTYDEMRSSEPIIGTGLDLINWVIGQVNWHTEPGGESPEDKAAADFLDSCRHDMSHTWNDFIADALTMLPFGWAWLEVVAKLRNGADGDPPSLYDDGRMGWRKLVLIGQDSLSSWDMDDKGGIRALIQTGSPEQGQLTTAIPIEKSVLFRMSKERNNPEGRSMLRRAYLAWYKKRNIEEIESIGIERDLTGVLIIHPPVSATQTDHDKARDLLEQYKADDMTGFIAPQFGKEAFENWGFDIINSPGSKSIDPDRPIRRYSAEIARCFLAQFLLLGDTNTGSFALSKTMKNMFEIALGAILINIEETINRFLVPPLFRYNDFGNLTALPQIKAGRVSKSDLKEFGEGMKALVEAGLMQPDADLQKFIREEFELPAATEPIETETKLEDTGQEEDESNEAHEFSDEDDFDIDWSSDRPTL